MSDSKMGDEHLKAVHRLADVLTEENAALKRLDFTTAIALVGAKEAALGDLMAQPAVPVSRTALAQRLVSLAAENQILLERAISVQTRIVRIVARAATPSSEATRYNGYGHLPNPRRAAALAVSTRA